MTPTSKKDSEKSHDPLADLDDDLGDDWESAFQAEDFMFSPEDESTDFFLLEDDAGSENEDISGLFSEGMITMIVTIISSESVFCKVFRVS